MNAKLLPANRLSSTNKKTAESLLCIPGMENNQENGHFFSRMLTRKKKSSSKKDSLTLLKEMIDSSDDCFDPLLTFSEKQLSQATNNYDSLHLLHSGGGYKWYKGSLEGQIVSIKKAEDNNEWPKLDHAINNIAMAVEMNSQVNSLKIIGICLKPRIPIMVYEFAKNGTLYDYIHNSNGAYSDHPFAWKSRLRTASEIATTVAYLHTAFRTPIIHRDINPSNVFLDRQYAAKLSDFSLSVSLPERETQAEVEVCGDFGFVSPEYLSTGILTVKSDVFSFGMLLVVLVTGKKVNEVLRRAQDDQHASFQNYLKTVIQSDEVNLILDPRLLKEGGWIDIQQQVQEVTELALRCIENNVDERPTMVDVTKQLKQIAELYSLTASRYNYGQSLRINWGIGQHLGMHTASTNMLVLEKMIESCYVNCDPIRTFSAKELEQSTNNYDSHHLVGSGGFFKWYKGYLDGRYVYYIKKHGENNLDRATIDIVIALHMNTHSNVLKLIGICFETEIPVGVYEFPENGNLSDHIRTSSNEKAHPPRPPLLWESRLRIATEIAKTVAYLHTAFCRPIIHRDIKPSHVFLDQYNVAKLSDFDLAIEMPEGETQVEDNRVCGTLGYIAPEYAMNGSLTEKADVYSFGVLLQELLTGRKIYDLFYQGSVGDTLHDYFGYHVRSNKVNQILDPRILEEGLGYDAQQQVQAVTWLALRCRDTKVEERPTMVDVAYQLDQIAEGSPQWQWLALRCTEDTNVEERPKMVDVAYQLDQISEGSIGSPQISFGSPGSPQISEGRTGSPQRFSVGRWLGDVMKPHRWKTAVRVLFLRRGWVTMVAIGLVLGIGLLVKQFF